MAQVNGYYLVDEIEIQIIQGSGDIYYPGVPIQSFNIPTPGPLVSQLPLPVSMGGNPLLRAVSNYQSSTAISNQDSYSTTQLVPGTTLPEGEIKIFYTNTVSQRELVTTSLSIKHKTNSLISPDIRFNTYLYGYIRIKGATISDYNALLSTVLSYTLEGPASAQWATAPQCLGSINLDVSTNLGASWMNLPGLVGAHNDMSKNLPEVPIIIRAGLDNYIYFRLSMDSEAIKSTFSSFPNAIENLNLTFNILPNYTPAQPLGITWDLSPITTYHNECTPNFYISRQSFGSSYVSPNLAVKCELTRDYNIRDYVAFVMFDTHGYTNSCGFALNFSSIATITVPSTTNINLLNYFLDQPNSYRGIYMQMALIDIHNPQQILFSNLIGW